MPIFFHGPDQSWPAWQRYRHAFLKEVGTRYGPDKIAEMLAYARDLYRRGLPIIYEPRHLAGLIGYESSYLYGVANSPVKYYRTFQIWKRSGQKREISEPLPSLKEVQHWILENILEVIEPSRFAKGFVAGRSIKDNARFHRAQEVVLSVDIKSFFPSITTLQVFSIFRRCGYTRAIAMLLTRLCTLNGSLPQGAPTSPMLSNIVALPLDSRLSGFATSERLRYTRYADDITFSGTFSPGRVYRFIAMVVQEEGFSLNEAKTRVLRPHQRQLVTGVVVNKVLQAPRGVRRELRKIVYHIQKFGLPTHMQRLKISKANYVSHLLGIASYISSLNADDPIAKQAVEILTPLLPQLAE